MVWLASGLRDVIFPLALPAFSAPGPGAETGFKVLAAGEEECLLGSSHFW